MALPAHHTATGFINPWPSAAPATSTWSSLFSTFPLTLASSLTSNRHARTIRVVKPEFTSTRLNGLSIHAIWLGHASAFVRIKLTDDVTLSTNDGNANDEAGETKEGEDEIRVLFDPIFSSRAGPSAFVGPSRRLEAPCEVDDLPRIDVVCISHNHYDHLDLQSILSLYARFPAVQFYVPLGNKKWFQSIGISPESIVEMDWWEKKDMYFDARGAMVDGETDSIGSLRISCVPAQHNSGRRANDQSNSLWCGWVIERRIHEADRIIRRGSIYFAGDTGYRRASHSIEVCPAFKELGEKLGPFDLSFIPIWRGGTLGFVSWAGFRIIPDTLSNAFHATPADAVEIHKEVKSRQSVAIHFGTFNGSENETLEAIVELREACEREGIDDDGGAAAGSSFLIKDIGESIWIDIVDEQVL